MTQNELARRSSVSQSVVAQLETLDYRRISRLSVLKVVARGLEMEPAFAGALIWLYDGEALTEKESGLYFHTGIARDKPRGNTHEEQDPRRTVLELLETWIESEGEQHQATARLAFQGDDAARLATMHEILRLERIGGQRLLVTKYPSSLTNTPDALESQLLRSTAFSSVEARKAAAGILRDRRHAFLQNLEIFGERSIHSKEALTRYVTSETGFRMGLQARRRHVGNWIDLLAQHPHYEVGLLAATPQLEVGIKSTFAAVVRAAPRDDDMTKTPMWGLSHIFWYGERPVARLLLDFERRWEQVPPEDREKGRVIAWLSGQIEAVS